MAQAALKAWPTGVKGKKNLPPLTGDKLVRECGLPIAELAVDAADVQGLVFRGYGALPECCYPLLRIEEPERGRAFVRAIVDRVSRGVPAARTVAVQIAFTSLGLSALGLPQSILQQFSRPFLEGMVGAHRSRFLGDTGESSPKRWEWGGPSTPPVHVLLMLFAESAPRLEELLAEMRRTWEAHGLSEIRILRTNPALLGKEHFGFADGISQPAIEGYHPVSSRLHLVKPGEFLRGYVNEYGLYTERPLVEAALDPFGSLPLDVEGSPRRDLGRNGTYLVFRQLRQNVVAFRETLDALTRNPDGSPNRQAREYLAARMVGRWPSGASLVEAPHGDDPTKARNNLFRYHHEDRDGLKCPIGAHVRRANPRDALAPHPGSERSLEVNRRHRLLRRGRTYGPELAPDAVDGEDRGLMFIALNANIVRQFEFVQHSWLVDPRFNGLYGEADPIVGMDEQKAFTATIDPVPVRCTGLPRFVTVVGGAYFFMPGIRALRFLGRLPTDTKASS